MSFYSRENRSKYFYVPSEFVGNKAKGHALFP